MSVGCKHCEELLTKYLDARLEPGTRAEVEQHLAACAACRRTHALLAGAARALAADGPAQPPPGLAARAARAAFAAADASESRPGFVERWIRVAWPTAAAASVATVLLLAFGLRENGGNGQVTPDGDPVALIAQAETESSEMVRSVLALEEE